MKIAVIGSRTFKDKGFIESIIAPMFEFYDGSDKQHTFISGGANGVDSFAEEIIYEYNSELKKNEIEYNNNFVLIDIIRPEWDKFGKSAGILRNKIIVAKADHLIIFWDGKSKGTESTIQFALQANKSMDIYVRT